MIRRLGGFFKSFFKHQHKGQLKQIFCNLLQISTDQYLPPNPSFCLPSSSTFHLPAEVSFLQFTLGSGMFLFAAVHKHTCPCLHVSKFHCLCHFFFPSVLNSLPLFVIPIFNFSSISNLFSIPLLLS